MSPQSTRFARVIGAILAVLIGYQCWAFWYGDMPPHIRLWLLLMALSTGVAPVGPQPIRGLPRIELQLQIVVDLFTASICTIGTWIGTGWIASAMPPTGLALSIFALACIFIPGCRSLASMATATLAPRRNYLIYGHNNSAASAAQLLSRSPARIDILGFIADDDHGLIDPTTPYPVFDTVHDATAAYPNTAIDGVIIVRPNATPDQIVTLRRTLRRSIPNVYLASEVRGDPDHLVSEQEVASLKCYLLGARELEWPERVLKRIVDIVIASIAVVFFLPLMLVCAALIKFESPGPVIFRQLRYTTENRLFQCYKLRTMRVSKGDGPIKLAERNDARVTRIGKFLRRTSLDEIPQFINVLQGHMSVVGPRPHAPGVMAAGRTYEEVVVDFVERYKVKPGITGLAQVSGLRGNTFTERDLEERFEYDMAYISNWSLALEVLIIFKTLSTGFGGKNAF